MDKQIEIKRGEGLMVDLLNQEMNELQEGLKQKQVEEMYSLFLNYKYNKVDWKKFDCIDKDLFEFFYNAGYRKIPENAVVLTREELFRDSTQLSKEKQIENIHNIILENLDYGYEETATAIYDANYRKIPKLGVILPFDHYDNLLKTDKQVRKETAEKFAENVNQTINAYRKKVGEDKYVVDARRLIFEVNEICKEITDKVVQNGN